MSKEANAGQTQPSPVQGSALTQITPYSSSWWLCVPISEVPNHPSRAGALTVTLCSKLLSQHQLYEQQQTALRTRDLDSV